MNQKKMMYNELFSQIGQEKNKNSAFVEANDYRLNFTFLYEIFEENPSKLFLFLCRKIMGTVYMANKK